MGGSSVRPVRSQIRSASRATGHGESGRHVTRGGLDPGGSQDPGHELVHGPRLSVGNDERTAGDPVGAIDGGDERVGGVVDVGRVDQRGARTRRRRGGPAGLVR